MVKAEEAAQLSRDIDARAAYLVHRGLTDEAAEARVLSARVRTALLARLDAGTFAVLKFADKRAAPGADLVSTTETSSIKLHLWGNTGQDPETVAIEFKNPEPERPEEEEEKKPEPEPEKNKKKNSKEDEETLPPPPPVASTSVPKGLNQADVAIRVLQLAEDPFSPVHELLAPCLEDIELLDRILEPETELETETDPENIVICKSMFEMQATIAIERETSNSMEVFATSFSAMVANDATCHVNPGSTVPGPTSTGGIGPMVELVGSLWNGFNNTTVENVTFTLTGEAENEVTVVQNYNNHITNSSGLVIPGTENDFIVTHVCMFSEGKLTSWVIKYDQELMDKAKECAAAVKAEDAVRLAATTTADSTTGANPDENSAGSESNISVEAGEASVPNDQMDEEENDEDDITLVDMIENETLGGVIIVDLVEQNDGPTLVRKWSFRNVTASTTVNRLTYPLAHAPKIQYMEEDENGKWSTVAGREDETMEAVAGCPPWDPIAIGCYLSAPTMLKYDTPELAWWDANDKVWRNDGFSKVSFDKDTSFLRFETIHLAPITLIQSRTAFSTLHDWELKPAPSEGGVLITIRGDTTVTELEARGHYVRMLKPELPCLADLSSGTRTACELIDEMVKRGFNIFPALERPGQAAEEAAAAAEAAAAEAAAKAAAAKAAAMVSTAEDDETSPQDAAATDTNLPDADLDSGSASDKCSKSNVYETRLYKQMSQLAHAFYIRESVWNQVRKEDEFVLRVALAPDTGKPPVRSSWNLFFANGQKSAYQLLCDESSPAFSDDFAEGVDMYGTIYHAMCAGAPPEAKRKVEIAPPAQSYSLLRLLCALRPLEFSTALGAKAFQEKELKRLAKEKGEAEALVEAERVAKEKAELETSNNPVGP